MSDRGASRGERRRVRRVIVVGSGVAGMSAALELARMGIGVLLFGRTPALGSGSVCQRDGIAAAEGIGPGDAPQDHFLETLLAGDFAAHQPPVQALCEAAPELVAGLARIGVPFERNAEGRIHRDRVAGSSLPRAARAGSCTAEQVLRALDRELLRRESADLLDARGVAIAGEPLISRLVPWELLSVVLDDNGVCVGVVAADLRSGRVRAFVGDAVCVATGGFGALWAGSCADAWADGAAIARLMRQGAVLANPEFVAWQPTALPRAEKAHALPEAARVLGARLFTPKATRSGDAATEKERDYFVERVFSKARGLVWADETARAVFAAERRTVRSDAAVMLDLTALSARGLLGDLFEAIGRWTDKDAREKPIRVGARAEASLGGLWVDYDATFDGRLIADSPRSHATNVPGLYAAGSADYQYHGANRLAGNALAKSLFAGKLAARGIAAYRHALAKSAFDLPGVLFERAESVEQRGVEARSRAPAEGGENPFVVRDAIGKLVAAGCGIERNDAELDALSSMLDVLTERAEQATVNVPLTDPALRVAHALPSLVGLARAIVLGARAREECRGSHYKPVLDRRRSRGAPERGTPKTTLIVCGEDGLPRTVESFDYTSAGRPVHVGAEVDVSLIAPQTRDSAEPSPDETSEEVA